MDRLGAQAGPRNIKQNLFFAFAYNTLGVPVAAGLLYPATGMLLPPMITAVAMSLTCVLVTTHALRLRRFDLCKVLGRSDTGPVHSVARCV